MNEEQDRAETLLAIKCMLISSFFFSIMNLLVKSSGDLPVMQKAFFRNFVTVFFAAAILKKTGTKFYIPKGARFSVFMRSLMGCFGIVFNFMALKGMLLSNSTAIANTSPFFTLLFSHFMMKDDLSKRQLGIIVVAFLGSLLVAKPTADIVSSLPAIYAFISAFTGGIAMAFLRKATVEKTNPNVIVFSFSAFSVLTMGPIVALNYAPMTAKQLCMLLGAGVAGCGGQVFVTKAYSHAPASKVSMYTYAQIIFASIWTVIFYHTMPDALSFLGYALIVGMGCLLAKKK